jgi:hypothetical protein
MVRKFRPDSRRLYRDRGNEAKSFGGSCDLSCLSCLSTSESKRWLETKLEQILNHRGSVIQLENVSSTSSDSAGRQLRYRSPLLFAVCALHGLRFSRQCGSLLNSPIVPRIDSYMKK